MEKYTVAELDVITLANAETVSASTVVPGENELPILQSIGYHIDYTRGDYKEVRRL